MNPLPTLHMGCSLCSIPPQGRVPNALVATDKHFPIIDDGNKSDASGEDWLEVTGSASHCDRQDSPIEIAPAEPEFTTPSISRRLSKKVKSLQGRYFNQTLALRRKMNQLKLYTQPKYKQILKSGKDSVFDTGIPKLELFHSLCEYAAKARKKGSNTSSRNAVAALLRAKYKGFTTFTSMRCHQTKLCIADDILLTLMKLRLGLLPKDLADR